MYHERYVRTQYKIKLDPSKVDETPLRPLTQLTSMDGEEGDRDDLYLGLLVSGRPVFYETSDPLEKSL